MNTSNMSFRILTRIQRSIIFSLFLIFTILPSILFAQTVSIRASDDKVYLINILPNSSQDVLPNFKILSAEAETPVLPDALITAELYATTEAFITFKTTVYSDTIEQVAPFVDAAIEDSLGDTIGTVGGIITSVAISTAAGTLVAGPAGTAAGLTIGLLDAAATISTDFTKKGAKSVIAHVAYMEARIAEQLAEKANNTTNAILGKAQNGQVISTKEISDAFTLRLLAGQHDIEASKVAYLLEADINNLDTALNYINNAIPGGSTASALFNLTKDFAIEDSDSLQVKAAMLAPKIVKGVEQKAEVLRSEMFGEDALNENIIYLTENGFFNQQQALVDQHNAEEAQSTAQKTEELRNAALEAEAARLVKEEAEKKLLEMQAKQVALEKDLQAETASLDNLSRKLANSSSLEELELALNRAKKPYKDNKSRRRMLSGQIKTYKSALKQLTGTIKVYKVTINGQVFIPKDIPNLQSRINEQQTILDTLVAEFEKPGGLEEKYDAAKNRYRQLKNLKKQNLAIEEEKRNLEIAIENTRLELLAAEEAKRKAEIVIENSQLIDAEYAYNTFPSSELPIEQPTLRPDDQQANWLTRGSPDQGIADSEKGRLQNEHITMTPLSSVGSRPAITGTWGGFQVWFKENSGTGAIESVAYEPLSMTLDATNQQITSVYISNVDDAGSTIFNDDFENGLGNWQLHGSPLPDITTANAHSGAYAFSTNGDSMYASGAINNIGFTLKPGVRVRVFSKIHAFSSASTTPWQHHDITLTPSGLANFTGTGSTPAIKIATINHHGEQLHGTATPGGGVFYRNSDTLSWYQTTGTARYGEWTAFDIEVNGDGSITYYQDDVAVHRTNPNIATPYFGQDVRVYISGREVSTVNLIDDVLVDYAKKTVNTSATTYTNISNLILSTYDSSSQGSYSGEANYQTTTSNELADYDYLTWGTWQKEVQNSTDLTNSNASWIIGQVTLGGSIPTSASATYNGSVEGLVNNGAATRGVTGSASLTANFDNRTLTGTFNNMKLDNNTSWKTLDVNAGWNAGGNDITGTLTGGGATGTVQGHFFGPQAQETGGQWQTTAGAEKAAGIYRAVKQ